MILSSQQIKRTDGFVYLYELLDPSNFEIRYVGKTLSPQSKRLVVFGGGMYDDRL